MHHITDVAHYPQTDSVSDARLALPHAGDVALQVLTSIGERVQGHPGRAAADCCARPAWLDAMRAHLSMVEVGDALLLPGCMAMRI